MTRSRSATPPRRTPCRGNRRRRPAGGACRSAGTADPPMTRRRGQVPAPLDRSLEFAVQERALRVGDQEALRVIGPGVPVAARHPAGLLRRAGQVPHPGGLGVERGHSLRVAAGRQGVEPFPDADRVRPVGRSALVSFRPSGRLAHRERVGGAAGDDQRHLGARLRGRVGDVDHVDGAASAMPCAIARATCSVLPHIDS